MALSKHKSWLIPSSFNEKLQCSVGIHSLLNCKYFSSLNSVRPNTETISVPTAANKVHQRAVAGLRKNVSKPLISGTNMSNNAIIKFQKILTWSSFNKKLKYKYYHHT